MQCRSQGSRLLEFHRAHGITDSRSSAPRALQPSVERAPQHSPRGARLTGLQQLPPDPLSLLPCLIGLVLILWVGSILFADQERAASPETGAPPAEVAP